MKSSSVTSRRLAVLIMSAVFFALAAGAARAGEYKFPNGVTFTYPDGYQTAETKTPEVTVISLIKASDPTITFAVALSENISGADVIPSEDEETIKRSIPVPPGSKLITCRKMKVAGKDALLVEATTEANGASVFSRTMAIVSGNSAANVAMVVIDESKIDAGRKIAESIENSFKF